MWPFSYIPDNYTMDLTSKQRDANLTLSGTNCISHRHSYTSEEQSLLTQTDGCMLGPRVGRSIGKGFLQATMKPGP